MKKMLFSAALAMLITGCAQQTFTVGNKPTAVTPKETITHHFFVSGIGRRKGSRSPFGELSAEGCGLVAGGFDS